MNPSNNPNGNPSHDGWMARAMGWFFPSAARREDQRMGLMDQSTGLYNKTGLLARGADMLEACVDEGRPVSMAVLDCSDLIEVRSIYGSRVSRQLLQRVVRTLQAVSGERGLVARTGAAEFTVLLPGLNRTRALQAIHRVIGSPARIELDAHDDEIVIVPDLVVQEADDDRIGIERLHAQLCQYLSSLHEQEARRQKYLTRERERHSRPMGLVMLPDRPARMPRALSIPTHIPGDVTSPVPLAA